LRPWRSPGHRDGATRGCLGDRLFVRPARHGPQPSHPDGIPEAEPSTLSRSSRRFPSMRKRTQVPRLGPVYPTPATVTPTYRRCSSTRGPRAGHRDWWRRRQSLGPQRGEWRAWRGGPPVCESHDVPRSAADPNPPGAASSAPAPTAGSDPCRHRPAPGLGSGAGSSFRRGVCGGLRRRPRLTTRRPPRDRRPMPSAGRRGRWAAGPRSMPRAPGSPRRFDDPKRRWEAAGGRGRPRLHRRRQRPRTRPMPPPTGSCGLRTAACARDRRRSPMRWRAAARRRGAGGWQLALLSRMWKAAWWMEATPAIPGARARVWSGRVAQRTGGNGREATPRRARLSWPSRDRG